MITPRSFPQIEPGEAGVDADRLRRVEDFISGQITAGQFPGASVAAMRGGRIFLRRSWGTWCDGIRRDLPYAGEHRHLLWSFSKAISATVVAMALEEGVFDLDHPVADYLPEFASHGKEAIRVRQLLAHAAGIPSAPRGLIDSPQAWDHEVRRVCAAPPEWMAGSRTAYHASGIFLLMAEILRRAWGGTSWEDICRHRLFDPLGCPTLSFAPLPPGTPLVRAPQPEVLPHALGDHFFRPDGAATGTIDDILAVLELVLGKGSFRGRRLLREATCLEMLSSQHASAIAAGSSVHDAWGLGWHLRHPRGTSLGHGFGLGDKSGPQAFSHAGVHCVLGYGDAARDLAVVFVTTGSPVDGSGNGIGSLRCTVTDLIVDAVQ